MSISIIIPSFNGIKHLNDFLELNAKIVSAYTEGAEIVICDDKSTDSSVEFLKSVSEKYPCVRYVVNDKKGACSARNLAVSISKFENLLFIDNDVLLSNNYLYDIAKYITPDYYMIACRGYSYFNRSIQLDGAKLLHWKRGQLRFTKNILDTKDQVTKSYGVQGAYFLCNKKYFNLLGGFDSELFDPYLLEESDLMYRGLKRGWEITYAPDLVAWHKCGGTINSKVSPFTKYMSKRNRIIFAWKNIHSKRLLISNILNSLLGCFSPAGFKAFRASLELLPEIRKKRNEEKHLMTVTDLELLKRSKVLEKMF